MLKGYVQCVICIKHQQKWWYVMSTGKHKILLTRKTHLTKKVLWYYKLTNKTEIGWNIKKLWRHDQTKVIIFRQNKNRLHFVPVVQFPFGQPPQKRFYENVGLCWGSWQCLPLISSGGIVVGVWTKMIGRLERTFPIVIFQYFLE